MSFYGGLQSTAARLLAKYGQNITFTRQASSSLNPVTGVVTSTPATYTGYGAAFGYGASEVDGVLVQMGDIRLLLEATDTAPEVDHTCVIDSKTYRVMDVKTSSPAGTVTHYTVQLRR
jgi:hypothetical protein